MLNCLLASWSQWRIRGGASPPPPALAITWNIPGGMPQHLHLQLLPPPPPQFWLRPCEVTLNYKIKYSFVSGLYFGSETPGGVQMRMRSAHVTGTSSGFQLNRIRQIVLWVLISNSHFMAVTSLKLLGGSPRFRRAPCWWWWIGIRKRAPARKKGKVIQ